jgi:hypothetical protein
MAFVSYYSTNVPASGVNPQLLAEQAAAQFDVPPEVVRFVNVDTGDSRGLGIHLSYWVDEAADKAAWDALILAHNGAQQTAGHTASNQYTANVTDAQTRWDASAIHGKTPAQIYSAMQAEMDSWTTLANARASLRVWLPAMAAAIAYIAKAEKGPN